MFRPSSDTIARAPRTALIAISSWARCSSRPETCRIASSGARSQSTARAIPATPPRSRLGSAGRPSGPTMTRFERAPSMTYPARSSNTASSAPHCAAWREASANSRWLLTLAPRHGIGPSCANGAVQADQVAGSRPIGRGTAVRWTSPMAPRLACTRTIPSRRDPNAARPVSSSARSGKPGSISPIPRERASRTMRSAWRAP